MESKSKPEKSRSLESDDDEAHLVVQHWNWHMQMSKYESQNI